MRVRARHTEAPRHRDDLVNPGLSASVPRCVLFAIAAMVAVMLGEARPAAQARGQAAPPPTARATAPVDLTGYWVSVVSEDWQWRMVTPARGDVASLPLNAEGIKVANQWNPADEGSCRAYGAAAIMRMPGRLRISWEDDQTLKIETDAGQQTRRLRFSAAAPPPATRDAQGHTVARWEITAPVAAGPNASSPRWATLRAVTTNMQAGWLRRNGVPYSERATMTEYFDRFSDGTDEWFTVTTMVEDPTYLTQPLMVSSNFKQERDGSKFRPVPCRAM